MPYVHIASSGPALGADARQQVLLRASAIVSKYLGKPESRLMVRLSTGADICFAGSCEPAAHVEVAGIGAPTPEGAVGLCSALSVLIEELLGCDGARVFVVFRDVARSDWGVGGRMLA